MRFTCLPTDSLAHVTMCCCPLASTAVMIGIVFIMRSLKMIIDRGYVLYQLPPCNKVYKTHCNCKEDGGDNFLGWLKKAVYWFGSWEKLLLPCVFFYFFYFFILFFYFIFFWDAKNRGHVVWSRSDALGFYGLAGGAVLFCNVLSILMLLRLMVSLSCASSAPRVYRVKSCIGYAFTVTVTVVFS